MIRPVNRRVTVGAATVEILDGAERLRLRGMAAAVMTAVTHPGHARFQQLGIARSVRLVAVRTILHHRGMFPKEGPAPFGVAAQAILIRGCLTELFGVRRAMRIVAAGAGHLAFAVRHVGRTL